ncbi:MAG: crotonase [Candidatus Hecatellales archaeon B24]|nr:MAG: crotonase [Candidatus Hecatellales archaeon B24]
MAEETPVLYEVKGKAAWITLNRPKALNALSPEVFQKLNEALDKAEADPNVMVAVITGAGEKAFSAGADVSEFKTSDVAKVRDFIRLGQQTMLRIAFFPKVTLALVNGVAVGGGCELALACDLRIASENARFGQPEPRLGLIPGWGGTQNLQRIVGQAKARELLLTGRIIDAREAEKIGLASKVASREELEKAALDLIGEITALGPLAVKAIKEVLTKPGKDALEAGLNLEMEKFMECFQTEDRAEGVAAFFEKRKPEFKGR